MKDCVFCKIVSKKIPCYQVWEDKNHLAFLDINPVTTGMTLVIPKVHKTSNLFENTDETISELMIAAKKVSKQLEKALQTDWVTVAIEGFETNHLHVKLYPRQGEIAHNESLEELAKLIERNS